MLHSEPLVPSNNTTITETSNKREKPEDIQSFSEENEHSICTICSEEWTVGGDHCLVSLKCGHLFGRSCIEKWITVSLKKQNIKSSACPNCKKATSFKDIRIVLPINISVKDTAQQDEMKKELESKRLKIREGQREIENLNLSLNMWKMQLRKVQEESDNLLLE